ncbi:MAG TPA: PLP-dependent aminotransferase family protein, partial [Lachnospiraceae bacterium]|nr:PLP-dependent aminotransferase family protein [Lachnospiraceae bacterium]
PSKRSFAKNLDISVITVENAYAQLIAEGYIYSIPKKGFFVQAVTGQPDVFRTASSDSKKTENKLPETSCAADFISNRNNPSNFPFSVWAKLMRETISERGSELMIPSPSAGVFELRTAICKHLHAFRGMSVVPSQVIIGAGTEYLYSLLIQLLGRDKIYAVENPGYQKLSQIYESNGVACCYLPMDENGICLPALTSSDADVLHISPAHHFPTGIVTSIVRRYELLGWAAGMDSRYIIEDDFDSEFRMHGKPIPMLQSIDVLEKVIYMNTFSKSLSSTIRVSYMVLPPHLAAAFHEKLGFYSCTVSTFEQYTLARFINEGYFEKHINRMRTYYRTLQGKLLSSIKNTSLSSKVTILAENAGLHFLLRINTSLSDKELVAKAARSGLLVSCLSQYCFDDEVADSHTLIINYSGIDTDILKKFPDLLRKCIS